MNLTQVAMSETVMTPQKHWVLQTLQVPEHLLWSFPWGLPHFLEVGYLPVLSLAPQRPSQVVLVDQQIIILTASDFIH